MTRLPVVLLAAALSVAACVQSSQTPGGVYRIQAEDTAEIQYRMLDSINTLRAGVGAQALTFNPRLTAAAETHSRDMSRQDRAWPFGSNGSSPYDRVRRAGYTGFLVGEVYSQSFETELETLTAWIEDQAWRAEILNPQASEMGFGWSQDPNGLIWWTITLGDSGPTAPAI